MDNFTSELLNSRFLIGQILYKSSFHEYIIVTIVTIYTWTMLATCENFKFSSFFVEGVSSFSALKQSEVKGKTGLLV